jgi:hypothetical protein
MKFPNHIILDVSKSSITHSNQYWIFKYVFFINNNKLLKNLSFHKKFFINKESLFLNKLTKDQSKFTIKYNYSNPSIFLNEQEKTFFKNVYSYRPKVKHKLLESKHNGKEVYDYLINLKTKYDEKTLKRLIKNFSFNNSAELYKSNKLWNLFDINFLRKERIYTKLKYSRVPQYDIVSGGSAALLAGFLGFLITEKFGFELVDSGDFYFVFMYLVFLFFFIRLFLKIMNNNKSSWNSLSIKWLLNFYKTLVILFFKFIKNLLGIK